MGWPYHHTARPAPQTGANHAVASDGQFSFSRFFFSEICSAETISAAFASARENFRAAFGRQREAEFRVDDCLGQTPDHSLDLVLINPPFHQQHQVGDAIAWQMLKDARRTLVAGGELRLVGNRHLGYHAKLKKLFGNCTTIASDRKFVVLAAHRN